MNLQTMSLTLQSPPSKIELALLDKLIAKRALRKSRTRLNQYKPYSKQIEFHAQGKTYRERLFMAGNQLGKTLAGAAEWSMHLTGRYPGDWQGYRYPGPIQILAGSESYELTRDGVQRLLVGPPEQEEQWGTGYIPHDSIVGTNRRQGVPNALENITVRHVSGGTSTVQFKAYEQGRGKWQAATVHGVWFDEEPPEDVYFEGITRTNVTQGLITVTFTPLRGMSSVVARYMMETSPDRAVTTMTIDDADHYTPEQRKKIIDSYPPHEREARTKGVPSMGSGRIFPVTEESIVIDPITIDKSWVQIGGMDFGYDHPFGAVCVAWDRDADVLYITKEYREREATPIIHSAAVRGWGTWLPWSWPHDGLQHDKGSGVQLMEQYRAQGLNMLQERATFLDGTNGVEAGVSDMLQRMQTGRFKVFSTCRSWLEEFRLYHREDGKIVKERDDLISASRYALMMLRFAETGEKKPARTVRHGAGSWMG
jgi:phage terminase large subunit-like protein